MSYLNQAQNPQARATAVAGTVAFHALLGLAVVTGLTITGYVTSDEYEPIIQITPDPLPKPPPPEPKKQQQAQESFVTAPTPPIDPIVTNPVDITVKPPTGDQTLVLNPSPIVEPVADPPRSIFTPRKPRPINNPARWITTDDYPSRELRGGAEGVAAYRLIVSSSGQATACEVTRSTGSGGLDDATCKFLLRRSRFEPATDETGAKVVGTYTGNVKWEIPE
jgi:periplasmic protein TonB